MRYQNYRINGLPISLRMQRGLAVKVSFQAGRAGKGQLNGLSLWQRPKPQFSVGTHCGAPLLKKSGW